MKAAKLIIIGVCPALAGCLLDPAFRSASFLSNSTLMGMGMLVLWGVVAYLLTDRSRKTLPQVLLLNGFGIVMLGLNLLQSYLFGHYWMNPIGYISQVYFLLCLNGALKAFGSVFGAKSLPESVCDASMVTFVCMFLVSLAGSAIKQIAKKQ